MTMGVTPMVGDHAVQALLGGVVEATVAELARHDQRDGQALGLAVGVGAGGWSIFLPWPQAARLSTMTAHSSTESSFFIPIYLFKTL